MNTLMFDYKNFVRSCARALQRKYEEASCLNERVLTIRAAAFGEEDVSYGHALNTRATLLCKNVSFEEPSGTRGSMEIDNPRKQVCFTSAMTGWGFTNELLIRVCHSVSMLSICPVG